MKFLCVPCDTPMKLQTVAPPERGALSVVYACPECGYEMAMLTNPYETQLVQSLGVRIAPSTELEASPSTELGATLEPGTSSAPGASAGKCPFAAMVPASEGGLENAGAGTGEPARVRWTSGAEARLANIPAFVRDMARTGIERFARERGALEVNEAILDEARAFFGM